MEEISFSGLVVVAAIALLAPLVLGLVPRLRLPAVVLEIVAGIVVGPAVLDWVPIDTVIRVFALFGLAFLLFLAGFVVAGGLAVVGLLPPGALDGPLQRAPAPPGHRGPDPGARRARGSLP